MFNLHTWTCKMLSKLGLSEPNDIVSYLMEVDEPSEVEEYLKAMLDISDSAHKSFIKEFLQKHAENKSALGPGFYRKPDIKDDDGTASKAKIKEKILLELANPNAKLQSTTASKKKSKYVNLYSDEGHGKEVILLPGRHKCNCQASKHNLVNNCIKCGRIVCEQEGSGPCAFCGNLVVSNEEKEMISKGTKKGDALHNRLVNSKKISEKGSKPLSKGLQKALDHRNKLLEYDKTSEKRTKVYDDESDYFQTGSNWIHPEDRERLVKREEEIRENKYDRSKQKISIDLLGRKLVAVDDESQIYDPDDPIVKEILENCNPDSSPYAEHDDVSRLHISRPEYIGSSSTEGNYNHNVKLQFSGGFLRLQDREIQEMQDEGMCLSMHQPWATLLIVGMKIHEGRTWYSAHRGRLWIAAGGKVPTEDEISQVEEMYKSRTKKKFKFPHHYPTGCLLGCVNVIDVLPQEEYKAQYPNGESESPYVFICENPLEMTIKFPMKGQHKLYKIDSKVHKAAQKSLKIN